MSSLRFWSRRWRSSLFCDQTGGTAGVDGAGGSCSADSVGSLATLELRLYREIRSCPSDLEDAEVVEPRCVVGVGLVAVCGRAIWGWKDGGGYTSNQSGNPILPSRHNVSRKTYNLQPPPGQYPLCSRRDTTSVALQIPYDVACAQLREHLGYLLHLGRVDDVAAPATPGIAGPGAAVTIEEPSDHEVGHDCEREEGRDVDGRFFFWHRFDCV